MSGSGVALDWQFAVVTLAALWGAWVIARPLLRWRAARKAACPHCASGEACASPPASPAGPSQPLVQIGSGRSGSAHSGAKR